MVESVDREENATDASIRTGCWPRTPGEFERLVEEFQNRLVRFAFNRLGNLADAEDVAQEVFTRAYADRDRRRTVANVRAYLYRMAANLSIDFLRKRKHGAVSLDEARIIEIPTRGPSSSDAASAAEELRRTESLLRRLPRRQAEAVRLRVLDDLSMNEIAEILGCGPATAKSRLRYGLEKLRKIVEQEWEVTK